MFAFVVWILGIYLTAHAIRVCSRRAFLWRGQSNIIPENSCVGFRRALRTDAFGTCFVRDGDRILGTEEVRTHAEHAEHTSWHLVVKC